MQVGRRIAERKLRLQVNINNTYCKYNSPINFTIGITTLKNKKKLQNFSEAFFIQEEIIYSMMFNSLIMLDALAYLSTINNTKRISTAIAL